MSDGRVGVSFVVPVHNGAPWIRDVIEAIWEQADGRPMEIIVVDDRSDDRSPTILRELAIGRPLRLIEGEGRGAAAAINLGVRAAQFPLICQVDQDVVLQHGWMRLLAAELTDPAVAAAQGYYTTDPDASWCARIMGLDLEQRYGAIQGRDTDHVCTGNAIYRADALHRVELFDERFGYGYDNDMSYRLLAAGYRMTFCRSARSVHRWREGFAAYCGQQYGFGYGRLELIAKHPERLSGDVVSPAPMMLHPAIMSMAVVALGSALVMRAAAGPWRAGALGAAALITGLAVERLVAGIRAARRFRDPAPLLFPFVHLARDAAWVAAVVMWSIRRLGRHPTRPSNSMRPRAPRAVVRACPPPSAVAPPTRVLVLIPAHNEAATLAAVIADVRGCCPDLDLLVIDDGSTDATLPLVEGLGTRWLRFPQRMGIGSAMRAGLRYAVRLGYDAAVRLDGDGQHRADDIARVLAPLLNGRADVALASRYTMAGRAGSPRPLLRLLGVCLSRLTGRPVTDPTSGFCALGPRAVRLLAEHHPTGYPEPELRLFLSRNGLTAIEVPVCGRARLGGKTSLTPARVTAAGARVLLAMIIVPLRSVVGGLGRD